MKTIIITLVLCANFSLLFSKDKDTLDIKLYPAIGESKNIVILILGGSEGGFPGFNYEAYTKAGYPCMGVAYFRTENTPKNLKMIPLEYFEKVLRHVKTLPELQDKKIVVCGGSKGAELALLLASRYPEIQGVIAKAPSSVVFQCIGGKRRSSWSYKKKPLQFVPYADHDYVITNHEYVRMYQLSLENKETVEKAIIHVENINGPVLLFSGKEDLMWPSSYMSEMIIQRLSDNDFKFDFTHFAYDNAGHTLNEQYPFGGTSDGNKNARIDSDEKVFSFLEKLTIQ